MPSKFLTVFVEFLIDLDDASLSFFFTAVVFADLAPMTNLASMELRKYVPLEVSCDKTFCRV